MTSEQPAPPVAPQATYWQASSTAGPDYQIVPRLRVRLVALVAALVVQAIIALLGVLPELPGGTPEVSDSYLYASSSPSFWVQFAVIEVIAAIVVSLGFGPGVRFRDVPVAARFVLGLAFVVVPAVAILLGAINAAPAANGYSPAVAASGWLTTAFFATLFFGLPLIALVAHAPRTHRV